MGKVGCDIWEKWIGGRKKDLVEEDVSNAANLVEPERLDGAPSRAGVLAPERHEGLSIGAWGGLLPRRAARVARETEPCEPARLGIDRALGGELGARVLCEPFDAVRSVALEAAILEECLWG